MERVLEIAAGISTPLALSAFIAAVFFLVVRQVLAKNIFPKLVRTDSYKLIRHIVDRLFILALIALVSAMLLAFVGYFLKPDPSVKSSRQGPPFRVSYLLLEEHAIDFLLERRIEEAWSRDLSGITYVVPNSVFENLQYLQSRFSAPGASKADLLTVRSGQLPSIMPQTVEERQERTQFLTKESLLALTWGENRSGDIGFDFGLSFEEFASEIGKAVKDPHWKPDVENLIGDIRDTASDQNEATRKFSLEHFSATRYLDAETMHYLAAKYRDRVPDDATGLQFDFLNSLTSLPPRFVSANIAYSPDCPPEFYIGLVFPRMRVRVAVLENITNRNLQIADFGTQSVALVGLHSRSEAQERMKKARVKNEILFPQAVLKPDEKIVVPLELYFGDYFWKFRNRYEPIEQPISHEACLNHLHNKFIRAADEYSENRGLDIDLETFCSFASRFDSHDSQGQEVDKDIVTLGPVTELQSIEVDGVHLSIRKFDPKVLIINADFSLGTGSCPYLSIFDPQSKRWIPHGTFLTGNKSKELERTDRKALRKFHGLVRLEEKDREASYIDNVFVRLLCPDGSEHILPAQDPRLKERDGVYLVMKQGDELTMQFDLPYGKSDCRAELEGSGYYLPLRRLSASLPLLEGL